MPRSKRFGGMDGQHALNERGVLRVAHGGVTEKRAHGSEPGVAGAWRVVTVGLEVVEEGRDDRCLQVLQVQRIRCPARLRLHEAEQQPERVTVGGHGARTRLALTDQAVGEEGLQRRGERAHGWASADASSRLAARASSSGEAERYQ